MPRRISPVVVAALPRAYPLSSCNCQVCRDHWEGLGATMRTAISISPFSRVPSDMSMQDTVAEARRFVEGHVSSLYMEGFRDKVRAVRSYLNQRWDASTTIRESYVRPTSNNSRVANETFQIPTRLPSIDSMRNWNYSVRFENVVEELQQFSPGEALHPSVPVRLTGARGMWIRHWQFWGENNRRYPRIADEPVRVTRWPQNAHTEHGQDVPISQMHSRDVYELAPETLPFAELLDRTRRVRSSVTAAVRRVVALPTSMYGNQPMEEPLSFLQKAAIDSPLLRLLRKGGRMWSAEVEVDHLSPGAAASALAISTGSYSTRPQDPSVVSTSDSSVDAEIKISCMRDGAPSHQRLAESVYDRLYRSNARARKNTGHHVHVDGTRLADHGSERAVDVLWAATLVGRACHPALLAVCSSGYEQHRGYSATGGFARNRDGVMSKSCALHGDRVMRAASRSAHDLMYAAATTEFRMPNGTLEPVRAHAYVSLALGLVDLAERAILDEEPQAVEAVRLAQERVAHAVSFEEALAADFLTDYLALHQDSLNALALTAWTSRTASPEAKRVWRENSTGILDRVFHAPEEEVVLAHEFALVEDEFHGTPTARSTVRDFVMEFDTTTSASSNSW